MNSFTPYGSAQPVLLVNADNKQQKHTRKSLKNSLKEAVQTINDLPLLLRALEDLQNAGKKDAKKDSEKKMGTAEMMVLLIILFPFIGTLQFLFYTWVFSSALHSIQGVMK